MKATMRLIMLATPTSMGPAHGIPTQRRMVN